MENNKNNTFNVSQVKSSLDDLQNLIQDDDCSGDSLRRLSQALKDINEEINMLKAVIQVGVKI
ncbi:MAG: hypothetical protein HRT52_16290 [Colwellia sp.]|nr:hypothetical protein [Colwellia sp.]